MKKELEKAYSVIKAIRALNNNGKIQVVFGINTYREFTLYGKDGKKLKINFSPKDSLLAFNSKVYELNEVTYNLIINELF